jgi:hypothetical protein
MQGHRLPATLEVTGSNTGPGKINLIKKNTNGIPDSKKVHLSMRNKGHGLMETLGKKGLEICWSLDGSLSMVT